VLIAAIDVVTDHGSILAGADPASSRQGIDVQRGGRLKSVL
jgi:hypothetical protein